MKRLKLLVLLFSVCLFAHNNTLLSVEAKIAADKTAQQDKITSVANRLLGLAGPIAKKAINYIVDLSQKYKTTLKLSELLDAIEVPQGPVRKYLDKFAIQTPELGLTDTGLHISGQLNIDKVTLKAFLEVGLTGKKVYVIFYIQSPNKFRLSTLFPRAFTIAAFLKNLKIPEKKANAIASKIQVPDLFELDDAYLYISTTEVPKHSKLDDVYQGIGFKGALTFIGILTVLDEIFSLKGRPVKASGKINYKVAGSFFEVEIPTQAKILPESLTFRGKKIRLIPGTSVRLAPAKLKITLADNFVPSITGEGGFSIKFPFYKDPFEFFGGLTFAAQRLKIFGGQRTPIKNVFGLKDLHAEGLKVGFIWDLLVSKDLVAMSAEIGGIAGLLPVGVIFKGGLQSGKTKIAADVDMSLHGTRGLDIAAKAEGNIDLKDLAAFWLPILKGRTVAKDMIRVTPPMKLQDVKLNIAWSEDKSMKLNGEIGNLEIIPGIGASGQIEGSAEGISVNGSLDPITINNPFINKPMITITRSGLSEPKPGEKQGARFDFNLGALPPTFKVNLDGLLGVDVGAGIGKFETAAKMELSTSGLEASFKQTILDLETAMTLKAALDKEGNLNPKSIFIDATLENNGLAKLKQVFDAAAKEVFGVIIASLQSAKEKAISEIKRVIEGRKAAVQKQIDTLNDSISHYTKYCNEKNKGLKLALRPFCYAQYSVTDNTVKVGLLYVYQKGLLAAADKLLTGSLGQFVIKFGLGAAQGAVKTLQVVTKQLAAITKVFDTFMEKGFNVTYGNISGNVAELMSGKLLPTVHVKGHVLGKTFDEKAPNVDLKKPFDYINSVLKKVGIVK